MLTFSWKVSPSKKGDKSYIIWEAKWDGKHDDEWYTSSAWKGNPFHLTVDFQQAEFFYKTSQSEEDNPENLREVGDYVTDNPITRAYCEMLSNPKLIAQASGNIDEFYYYCRLIGNLSNLWD